MKRKPILFHKITLHNNHKHREVIGLYGTHHGVGVTYTGLMLAFYLGEELGKKTAFVECNDHHDMEYIHTAYDWTKEVDNTFSFGQITCYKEFASKRIPELMNEDYDCLVFDFGSDFLQYKEEFLRCQTKIVVGGRSVWDIQKLLQFINATKEIKGSAFWKYVIPQAENKLINRLKHESHKKIWTIPLTEEPTVSTRATNRVFANLLLA